MIKYNIPTINVMTYISYKVQSLTAHGQKRIYDFDALDAKIYWRPFFSLKKLKP